jgi:hypothetical protein
MSIITNGFLAVLHSSFSTFKASVRGRLGRTWFGLEDSSYLLEADFGDVCVGYSLLLYCIEYE